MANSPKSGPKIHCCACLVCVLAMQVRCAFLSVPLCQFESQGFVHPVSLPLAHTALGTYHGLPPTQCTRPLLARPPLSHATACTSSPSAHFYSRIVHSTMHAFGASASPGLPPTTPTPLPHSRSMPPLFHTRSSTLADQNQLPPTIGSPPTHLAFKP